MHECLLTRISASESVPTSTTGTVQSNIAARPITEGIGESVDTAVAAPPNESDKQSEADATVEQNDNNGETFDGDDSTQQDQQPATAEPDVEVIPIASSSQSELDTSAVEPLPQHSVTEETDTTTHPEVDESSRSQEGAGQEGSSDYIEQSTPRVADKSLLDDDDEYHVAEGMCKSVFEPTWQLN